jgi:rhamnosyltransferase
MELKAERTSEELKVAVIIRAKNEMPYVRPALEMIRRQTFQDFELFAVDSGSTDGTLEVLREFTDDTHLIQIPPEAYVPGQVLNDMIARANREIILLQNADAIPADEHCYARLLAPLFAEAADAVMCVQTARAEARFVVDYDYRRAYDPKNIKGDNADFFSAVTCAFKRAMWEAHPFRTHGYAEDVAWTRVCRRSGWRYRLVQDTSVEHSHNYTLKGLYRKKFRHGLTFAEIYGQRPQAVRQFIRWGRETVRDLLYTLRKGRLLTIPYNLAYRTVIHVGLYNGLRTAARETGQTARYDQLEKPE